MAGSEYEIRRLGLADVDAYVSHWKAHERQADEPGELPRGPYPRRPDRTRRQLVEFALERWSKRLDEPGWRRVWGLRRGDRVVGHASLTGPDLQAMLHRAELGIGIEIEHRGKGWGRRLVQAVLDWAREQPGLDWVDLGVFEGNTIALGLYRKLGFSQCGHIQDSFRVDGRSVDDVRMTLWVGAPEGQYR